MSRHVAAALVAILALHAAASADEADPESALRERGVVFKAGKKNYFVLVVEEAANTGGNKFVNAELYFGDAKTLQLLRRSSVQRASDTAPEILGLDDALALKSMQLERSKDTYVFKCGDWGKPGLDRTIKLDLAGEAEAKKLRASAKLELENESRGGFVLGREGTTYYYVDRPRLPEDNGDFRFFIGKRGAMKQVKVKEQSLDSKGATIVTAKGVLEVVRKPLAISWGRDAKHLGPITVVPVFENRKLIHFELGVYAREKTGTPCLDM